MTRKIHCELDCIKMLLDESSENEISVLMPHIKVYCENSTKLFEIPLLTETKEKFDKSYAFIEEMFKVKYGMGIMEYCFKNNTRTKL